jgi:hypothetical protein
VTFRDAEIMNLMEDIGFGADATHATASKAGLLVSRPLTHLTTSRRRSVRSRRTLIVMQLMSTSGPSSIRAFLVLIYFPYLNRFRHAR